MLNDFLIKFEKVILENTEKRSLALAGAQPSSVQLRSGLPIFYQQLRAILSANAPPPSDRTSNEKAAMAKSASENDEPQIAIASGYPMETKLAEDAGSHGKELMRLGYTLSHVVHAYGSMCQAITEVATKEKIKITANEFHNLNRCLDVAIAGAVTEFQADRDNQQSSKEIQHLGFLAHELRNALGTVTMSLNLIKDGTVGFNGSVGQVLDKGLKRIEELIDRSLTEVRIQVDPKVQIDRFSLFQLFNQIVVTAEIEARTKQQSLEIQVDPYLFVEADQQLVHSAVSNLIQNALKFTRTGGRIHIRGKLILEKIIIEVEDECGGLVNAGADLFKPFEQNDKNRKGLGLGLTISQKAIQLNQGVIDVLNMPGKGCIFKITLPVRGPE